MAIKEEYVSLRWSGSNRKYYESIEKEGCQAYKFTERNAEFKVKIEHLHDNATVRVTKVCDICDDEVPDKLYRAIVKSRKNGDGLDRCFKCGKKKSGLSKISNVPFEKSLLSVSPQIAEQLHPTMNGNLTSDKVSNNSALIVWWFCKTCKSSYEMSPNTKVSCNINCPYCSGYRVNHTNCLTNTHPDLVVEWDFRKNFNTTPNEITYGSQIGVHWKCKKCDHEWETSPNNRSKGSGCPKCWDEKRYGEGNPNWKNGISDLNKFLRSKLGAWQNDILMLNDHRCFISKEKGHLDVHHIIPFNVIRDNVMTSLNILINENVGKYTDKELKSIVKEFLKAHTSNTGIPIRHDIHVLFHSEYGWGNSVARNELFTFKENFINGKYESYKNSYGIYQKVSDKEVPS